MNFHVINQTTDKFNKNKNYKIKNYEFTCN